MAITFFLQLCIFICNMSILRRLTVFIAAKNFVKYFLLMFVHRSKEELREVLHFQHWAQSDFYLWIVYPSARSNSNECYVTNIVIR